MFGVRGQHAGVRVLRVLLLVVHVPLQVQREEMGSQYLSLQITFSMASKVPWTRAEVPRGVALGPPSGVRSVWPQQPCGTRCESGCSSSGWEWLANWG